MLWPPVLWPPVAAPLERLTAGASGGALVSGAFEATTLTLASLEPFLAFGFALAWKKTEKLVTENEAFVLLFWHVMRVMTSLQEWSLISCIPTTLQSKKDVRNWLATVRCCEKSAPSLANWLRLLRKCDVATPCVDKKCQFDQIET